MISQSASISREYGKKTDLSGEAKQVLLAAEELHALNLSCAIGDNFDKKKQESTKAQGGDRNQGEEDVAKVYTEDELLAPISFVLEHSTAFQQANTKQAARSN